MAKRTPLSQTVSQAAPPGRRVFYGWWLVGLAVFLLTLMSSTSFQGLGMYLVVLERKFGWSRTILSAPFALARVQGAVIGPLEGWLIDRIGSRRMILIGYTLMGIGFILFSQIHSIWQYILAYVVISLGGGLGGWLAVIAMVNNWFVRRRSFALATAMSGVHLGGFLVYALAFGLESHGFRTTTMGIGIFLLATALPVTRFIRNRPEDIGLTPDGDTPETAGAPPESAGEVAEDPTPEPDFTARQAMRTPVFWVLALVHMTSTISIVTLAVHLVPKLNDMGFSLTGAGIVISTTTGVAIVTQFAAGYLGDRLPKPPLIFVFLLFQAVSMLLLALAEDKSLAFVFAVLYGFAIGGRVPLMTAIRGDYYGRKAFATIMGLSMLPNNFGMMVAPIFAGYMFDKTGTYEVPFLSFAALAFLGALGMFFVRKPKTQRRDV
ncbi:MAG: MFS transporter, partial [Chloroflexi bacterium]|nr:MFS transporter [Chloroflexota bacterium]